jgi:hypothetical protein
MVAPEPITMRINLVDGTTRVFEFDPGTEDRLAFAGRAGQVLAEQKIAVQLKDRLIVFPATRIDSIEFFPGPEVAPEGVFANAREIHS